MSTTLKAHLDREPRVEDPSGREVFEILAREHAGMLLAFLRGAVRDPALVDELFQDTLLTAWRRLHDYDRGRPFGPWLRGIATRLVLRLRQRRPADLMCCEPEVLEALDRRHQAMAAGRRGFDDALDRLAECLRALPAKLREAIELCYREGMRLRAVAAHLDASEEAVKKRVQRARGLLAACLNKEVTT